MLDEFARQIGWLVIIGLAFYVIGKIIIAHGDEQNRKKELIIATWDHQRRLAFRKIWRSSMDNRVIGQVKMQYGPWALLDVDLNDIDYDTKMRLGEEKEAYVAALRDIEEKGMPYILENGEIVATFTNEYKKRSSKNLQN